MSGTDVAVVGGGIAGSSVAYHLSERTDASVTVFERDAIASETTAKSAAFFGFYGSDVERRLKRYGMALYNEILGAPRADPHHELVGRVRVATTAAGAGTLDTATGAEPLLEGDQTLHEAVLLPELDADEVTGATYRAAVGYHRPRELAREFAARAREQGVEFREGVRVDDVVVEDRRVKELVVDEGAELTSVEPRAVVSAAGPWNPLLLEAAGVDLPVSHSLAPILRLERTDAAAHTLPIVSHVESGVYVRGDGPGAVIVGHYPPDHEPGSRFDPDRVPDGVPDDRRAEMRRVIADLLPGLADAPVTDEWVGVRSHTPDGHPIVGWTDVAGLSVVSFHSSGIQLAPAAGRIVAKQLVGGRPTGHYDDVTIARFEGNADRRFSLSP